MENDFKDYIPMIHVAGSILNEIKPLGEFNEEEQQILDSYLNYYKDEIASVKEALPKLDMSNMSYNTKVKCIIEILIELKENNKKRHFK